MSIRTAPAAASRLDRYSHLYPSAHEALAEQLDVVYQASQVEPVSNVVELR